MAELGINGGFSGPSKKRRSSRFFLPEELQEKILLRLPIKSLARFESVCKTWLFMLSSRGFIQSYGAGQYSSFELHTIRTAHLAKMVPGLVDRYNSKTKTSCPGCVVRVWGPLSNGIYCLTSHHSTTHKNCCPLLTIKIALFNPATHRYKFTNPFPRKLHSLLLNICSKPCKLHFGFGYVNDDYRVVVLVTYNFGNPQTTSFLVLVYSVLRGAWKKIVDYEPGRRNAGRRKAPEAFNIQGRRIDTCHPVLVCPQRFFEGCYHWMAAGDDQWYVLSFNFADESFKSIRGPPYYLIPHLAHRLFKGAEVSVLHDHLAVIHIFDDVSSVDEARHRTVQVDFWMMMEYGMEESWARVYTMNPTFDCLIGNIYGIHYRPLQSGGICIERLLFEDSIKQRIVSWDDDDAGYELLNNVSDYADKVFWNTPGISTYIETLERL